MTRDSTSRPSHGERTCTPLISCQTPDRGLSTSSGIPGWTSLPVLKFIGRKLSMEQLSLYNVFQIYHRSSTKKSIRAGLPICSPARYVGSTINSTVINLTSWQVCRLGEILQQTVDIKSTRVGSSIWTRFTVASINYHQRNASSRK